MQNTTHQQNEIQTLIEEIFTILETELANHHAQEQADKKPISDSPGFLSVQIINEAQTLSKGEAVRLKEAAEIREEALVFLRKGELNQGKRFLSKAFEHAKVETLQEEGLLLFNTFQSAAKGFLFLREKNYPGALDAMYEALESHKILYLKYSHLIEVRRIHLARNTTKVLSLAGKTDEAFALTVQLINYTLRDNQPWPLTTCQLDKPDKLSLQSKMFVVNQLMNEVIFITTAATEEKAIRHLDTLIQSLGHEEKEGMAIILSWSEAYKALLQKDKLRYLRFTKTFFQHHRGLTPSLYDFMLTELGKNIS